MKSLPLTFSIIFIYLACYLIIEIIKIPFGYILFSAMANAYYFGKKG